MDFEDLVVVITGAGNGLGRAYAHLLASRGARVVVNDYGGTVSGEPGTVTAALAVVDEIVAADGSAVANGADVGAADSGAELVTQALDTWGRLDAVINNAGATRGGVGVEQNDVDDLLFTLNLQVAGTARLVKAAWPYLQKSGHGRVVSTSSDSLWGTPSPNYVTAKAAIFGYTRAIASEGAAVGIKANTVMPSAWTRMTADIPPGDFRDTVERHFPPEAVAPFVALLVHPDCPWNGEAFQVGAHRAAREFLAVTAGYRADPADPLADFAAHTADVADLTRWGIPADMIDSVDVVVGDLEGRPAWQ